MSAPDTNVKKQSRRHRGPLWGIAISLVWAGLLFTAFLTWTAYKASEPNAEPPLPLEITE